MVQPDSSRHRLAADPGAHVWVAASAGTGKTRSLTDRILRLLLAGAPSEGLFAITFARAAAAEMQRRVFARLASWSGLADDALDDDLRDLGEVPSAQLRQRARSLFLRVLDAPRGLEIRTIHSAAQALLAAFPVEAGLPPRADPLDARRAAALRRRSAAEAMEDPTLAADLERLAVEAWEGAIAERLEALLKATAGYAWIGGPDAVEPFLRGIVGLTPGLSASAIWEAAVTPPTFDDGAVGGYIAAMEGFGTEAKRAEAQRAREWLSLPPADRVANIEALFGCVLTSAGKPRRWGTPTPKVIALQPAFERLLTEVEKLRDIERALAFVDHAGAWLRFGMAASARYQQLKRAAAAVDFDDMVALAADLIATDGMANVIAERLDRRILHVLVDEAQDTNAAQWRLIEGLAAEFDAGLGQHDAAVRTRFVVGDFKQAIFRFQGTDPAVFLDVRARWEQATLDSGRPLRRVGLDTNFRSAPLILRLVDEVMKALGPQALGLPAAEPLPLHVASRADLPAEILLLPPHERPAPADDAAPETEEEEEEADPDFMDRLAKTIAALVTEGSPHRVILTDRNGRHHPAGPGDVLVLMQARGELMSGLVRALHAVGLPVAGVDRARLAEPLAVRDLLSLIRFVLQPADNLALAEVLTSPLGGLTHEQLRLCRRAGETLWQSVQASTDPALSGAQARVRAALRMADFAGPHAFLQAVLAQGARADFRARLGPEADDGIDALLAEALAFEADNPPTLQGFLAHVAAIDDPLARDPDSTPGLVRLMTVHGAKGLEAPIVVLADALRPRKPGAGVVAWTCPDGRASVPLVFGKAVRRPKRIEAMWAAAEAADAAEHNRLLYVALTRAEQLLVVAGQLSPKQAEKRAKPEAVLDSWHDRIAAALKCMGAVEAQSPLFGPHLRLAEGGWPQPAAAAATPAPAVLPGWALAAPPAETGAGQPLSPSGPAPDAAPLPPPTPAQRAAAARGTLLHRLFEHLPALGPAARPHAGRRLLAAGGIDPADVEAMLAEVLAVLDDPAHAALFGPASLAEVPIAGLVDGLTVAGTVDRLVILPERLLVIDFKTGLSVPATAEAAHPSYLRQMAAYRAVLRVAFPGHDVETALLYTAAPKLLFLPDKLLDAHWPPGKS